MGDIGGSGSGEEGGGESGGPFASRRGFFGGARRGKRTVGVLLPESSLGRRGSLIGYADEGWSTGEESRTVCIAEIGSAPFMVVLGMTFVCFTTRSSGLLPFSLAFATERGNSVPEYLRFCKFC